jgi:hypothetical protein
VNITYASLCPTCKASGEVSRLKRDLGNPEVVFCINEHKFQGPEIEDYLEAGPSTEEQISTAVNEAKQETILEAPPLPKEVGEIQESMQKAFDDSFAMAPPPVMEAPKGEATAKALRDVREEAAAKMAAKRAPAAVATLVEDPAPEPQPAPKPPLKPVRKLPGGRLLIEVEISDQHASFLMGEAETRGKTVEEHFREMVEYGLESRWFY